MSEKTKETKPVSKEQKPTTRKIDTSKTLSGVQTFNDSFMTSNNNKPKVERKK